MPRIGAITQPWNRYGTLWQQSSAAWRSDLENAWVGTAESAWPAWEKTAVLSGAPWRQISMEVIEEGGAVYRLEIDLGERERTRYSRCRCVARAEARCDDPW